MERIPRCLLITKNEESQDTGEEFVLSSHFQVINYRVYSIHSKVEQNRQRGKEIIKITNSAYFNVSSSARLIFVNVSLRQAEDNENVPLQ